MASTEDGDCATAASSFPPPRTESFIKDGAVSGVLPKVEVVAVHYPGYPSSASRAVETLGGLSQISNAWSCAIQNLGGAQDSDKDRRRFLGLKFRPEDPYCHPAFEGAEQLSADVVAKVSLAYHFEGMADYQHVIAVHAAESRRKKRPWVSDDELFLDDVGNVDMDNGDIMKLVPPLFARKDKPERIVLNPPANLVSESLLKGAVEYSWEMDIEPCHAIPFSIHKIPEKINWEDKLSKGTAEWEAQMAVSKLFEERPIWPRWSLHERLLDNDQVVSEYLLRRLLFRTGYYFSRGPFGRFWIRKGYDPREIPDSRIYQKVDFRMPPNLRNLEDVNENSEARLKHKWKDICKFQVWPSKASNCLQLFELDDEYIHEEIRKPTTMTSCSPLTGWFSEATLKALRLHVTIRFMEVTPNGVPEELLKSKIEHFKRCRKKEVLNKFWKPEKQCWHSNQDASHLEQLGSQFKSVEREAQKKACPLEDEECEEEEEELDGYESSQMVREDGVLPYTSSYEMGDIVPNEYLQELLCGFSYSKNGIDQQAGEETHCAGPSDDEYQIYEQDSDDEYDYL